MSGCPSSRLDRRHRRERGSRSIQKTQVERVIGCMQYRGTCLVIRESLVGLYSRRPHRVGKHQGIRHEGIRHNDYSIAVSTTFIRQTADGFEKTNR